MIPPPWNTFLWLIEMLLIYHVVPQCADFSPDGTLFEQIFDLFNFFFPIKLKYSRHNDFFFFCFLGNLGNQPREENTTNTLLVYRVLLGIIF